MTGGVDTSTAIVVAVIAAVPATVAAVGTVVRAIGAKDDRRVLDDLADKLDEHIEDDAVMQAWIVARLDGDADDTQHAG